MPPGRVTGVSSPAATAAQLDPAAANNEPVAAGDFRSNKTGRRRREFTADEDEIIRAACAGKTRIDDAQRRLKAGPDTFYRRALELGLPVKRVPRVTIPDCPPGWFPIAHGGQGKWRLYEGSPVTLDAARAAVAAGRATMAQRRIDGGFDLMFRLVRA